MNDSTAQDGIETEETTDESDTETTDESVEDSQEYLDEDDDGYSDDDDDSDEDAPEHREYDFGGKKFKLNKDALSDEESDQFESYGKGLQSDYTKKTQELASQRKQVAAREQSAEKLLSLQGDTLDMYSQGLAIRQELAQLNGIDLNQLWQSNPDQARQVSDAISQKTKEFKKAAEAEWRSDPVVTELAYKAMMFDKMKANAKKGSKVSPATATESKPVKGKGGRHKSNTPSDKDSAKSWLAKRNAQLRKRTG